MDHVWAYKSRQFRRCSGDEHIWSMSPPTGGFPGILTFRPCGFCFVYRISQPHFRPTSALNSPRRFLVRAGNHIEVFDFARFQDERTDEIGFHGWLTVDVIEGTKTRHHRNSEFSSRHDNSEHSSWISPLREKTRREHVCRSEFGFLIVAWLKLSVKINWNGVLAIAGSGGHNLCGRCR